MADKMKKKIPLTIAVPFSNSSLSESTEDLGISSQLEASNTVTVFQLFT